MSSPPPSSSDFSLGNRATMDAMASSDTPRTAIRTPSIQTASLAAAGAMSNKSAIARPVGRGRVADCKDAEVAGGTLLALAFDLQRGEVVLVGDEREVAGRIHRSAALVVDLLADIVGADDAEDAGNLGLFERRHGDI